MNRPTNFLPEASVGFAFLLAHGFSLSKSEHTILEYVSSFYLMRIYYGRRSWEIDIEIELAKPPSDFREQHSFSLGTLIRVFNDDAARRMPLAIPVTTVEQVRERVRFLARYFCQYVDLSFLRSRSLWPMLIEAQQRAIAESPWPKAEPDEISKRFKALWEGKRFLELVNFFEPLVEYLSEDEREKFKVASASVVRKPD
jgi:hypothetical protein